MKGIVQADVQNTWPASAHPSFQPDNASPAGTEKSHKRYIHAGEKGEKWRRNPFQPKVIIIIFAFNFDAISFILEPNWKKLDRCLRT